MKISIKNKTKLTFAIIIGLLMASFTLMAMPVQAQEGSHGGTPDSSTVWSTTTPPGTTVNWTFNPVPYLSFSPNPIGIGQTLLVNMWTTPPPAADRYLAGFTVTIQKPDATTDTVGPMHSYVADGTCWFEYTVDQVGTYKLKFEFPGQYFPPGYYYNGVPVTNTSGTKYEGMYYTPSATEWQELTVQNEPVMSWYSPLPTDYWTRPISPENREWWTIAGNYPWVCQYMGQSMNGAPRYLGPFITAPNTAHVVWKQQGALAGLIGGEAGQYGTQSNPGTPSVIYMGRCYQTKTVPVNGIPTSCAVCYDLRTGQQYYAIPIAQGGVTPSYLSYSISTTGAVVGAGQDQTFSVALLSIGAQLIKINPYTGAVTLNVTGLAYGSQSQGGSVASTLSGTYYNGYVLSVQNLGNTTRPGPYRLINWTTAGSSTNFASRIVSNISFPISSIGIPDLANGLTVSREGRMVHGNVAGTGFVAINLVTGQVLWNITTDETAFNPGAACSDNGKFAYCVENRYWKCFDILTGKVLWTTEKTSYPWGDFWGYYEASGYGLLYGFCYDGVYAFDWNTGKTVWHYAAEAKPFETPYTYGNQSVYSFTGFGEVVDGKLYISNNEHTPTQPIPRGWGLHCINATTGKGIWNITGYSNAGAASDGYLTVSNSYDGYMYVYGKGKSATTVSAPQTAITSGQNVIISGTVLDQSPAQPGTACVSKQSMTQWMEYLHMQHAIPSDVIGVPISIDAIDPNGNTVNIATVKSDISGTFAYTWAPELVGQYTVTASFAGDESYGSSWAETHVGVVQAPITTPIPTATSLTMPPFELYTIGSAVAVIIAIAIAVLLLRKRP